MSIKHFRYWTLELNPKSLDSLIKVILKVTLSFTTLLSLPIPFFQWYLQSQEILLNLNNEMLETQHLMHKVRE
jgi:hypothetical protein